jgi:hypothetical protein
LLPLLIFLCWRPLFFSFSLALSIKLVTIPNVPSENKTIQSSMSNMSFDEIVKDANIRKSAMVTSLIERAKEKLKNKG